jgi:hypothetical protein
MKYSYTVDEDILSGEISPMEGCPVLFSHPLNDETPFASRSRSPVADDSDVASSVQPLNADQRLLDICMSGTGNNANG